jgi:hypothetical protein
MIGNDTFPDTSMEKSSSPLCLNDLIIIRSVTYNVTYVKIFLNYLSPDDLCCGNKSNLSNISGIFTSLCISTGFGIKKSTSVVLSNGISEEFEKYFL